MIVTSSICILGDVSAANWGGLVERWHLTRLKSIHSQEQLQAVEFLRRQVTTRSLRHLTRVVRDDSDQAVRELAMRALAERASEVGDGGAQAVVARLVDYDLNRLG